MKLFGGELGNEATYVSTTNECFSIDETVQ